MGFPSLFYLGFGKETASCATVEERRFSAAQRVETSQRFSPHRAVPAGHENRGVRDRGRAALQRRVNASRRAKDFCRTVQYPLGMKTAACATVEERRFSAASSSNEDAGL